MTRRRITAAVVLAVCIAIGLTVHVLPHSIATDIAGDALYAAAVYAGIVLVAPRLRPVLAGTIAVAWCFAVELLQLTPVPTAAGAAFPPLRLVLGAGFDPRDLVVYALAIATAWGVDAAMRRLGRRKPAQ